MSIALVLSGGGARAAYQVGVLRAVSEILNAPARSPFRVICGTSAGAINSAMLACESDHFAEGVSSLESIWGGLSSKMVHEIGLRAALKSLYMLLGSLRNDGYTSDQPWSLLDNSPLQSLLTKMIRFDRLGERISSGDLDALSISVLGYTSGASLSFFQGNHDLSGWQRHRRIGAPTTLDVSHLMASAAIPGIYPSVLLNREYFGDGAVRQTAPLSPALHLGARKLFVVGVSHNPNEPNDRREKTIHAPSLAQMTMHFLNGSFIDSVEEDMESLKRLNVVLEYLNPEEKEEVELARVDVMSITPSKRFDDVAAQHIDALPRSMRFLFKALGATRNGGGTGLASYLLFEAPFIMELIECGYADAMADRDKITAFLT